MSNKAEIKQESTTRKIRRVVVSTGLHLLEDGGERSLAVYACITVREDGMVHPEVNRTFFVDPAKASAWKDKAVCGYCRESHELFSLLDALEEGDVLPMDLSDADCVVGIDVPVLVAQMVRWLRTPKLRSLDRRAS